MSEHLQAIATVLSLVNPAICAAMFSKIESGRSSSAKMADAIKVGIAIVVILGLAALFGAKALHVFGVSLDAFSVAGGFVLAWMGFGMIKGDVTNSKSSAAGDSDASLSPLILFAASPGTITGVITLAVAHSKMDVPITALIAIAVTVVVTVAAMLLVAFFGSKTQGGLARETITHLMGLIVLAMGVQFGLTGLRNFMG